MSLEPLALGRQSTSFQEGVKIGILGGSLLAGLLG
jgi:hypothetical protein